MVLRERSFALTGYSISRVDSLRRAFPWMEASAIIAGPVFAAELLLSIPAEQTVDSKPEAVTGSKRKRSKKMTNSQEKGPRITDAEFPRDLPSGSEENFISIICEVDSIYWSFHEGAKKGFNSRYYVNMDQQRKNGEILLSPRCVRGNATGS